MSPEVGNHYGDRSQLLPVRKNLRAINSESARSVSHGIYT